MKNFLLYMMIILASIAVPTSCGSPESNIEEIEILNNPEFNIGLSDCGENPYIIYGDHLFIDQSVMYETGIKFVFVKLEDEPERVNTSYIPEMISDLNKDFKKANISFRDAGTEILEVSEGEDDMDYLDDHAKMYRKKGYLTCFIYPSKIGGYAGRAGGIPSTFFAIKEFYMQSRFSTASHELAHIFGLIHTHAFDNSGIDNSFIGGDLICATIANRDPNSRSYLGKMDKDCNYIGELGDMTLEQHNKEARNFLAYSNCRSEFDSEQIDRMHFIIDQSTDLKQCFKVVNI